MMMMKNEGRKLLHFKLDFLKIAFFLGYDYEEKMQYFIV